MIDLHTVLDRVMTEIPGLLTVIHLYPQAMVGPVGAVTTDATPSAFPTGPHQWRIDGSPQDLVFYPATIFQLTTGDWVHVHARWDDTDPICQALTPKETQ